MRNLRLTILLICFSASFIGCQETTPSEQSESTQLLNELWEIFDRNYAFFELRQVDWKAEKKHYLPIVSQIDNDTLLFDTFCELLKKFDDTHINLESEDLNLYCNAGKEPAFLKEFPTNESFGVFLRARDKTLKKLGINKISDSESKIFQFGFDKAKDWGYVRIKRFYGAKLDQIRLELDDIIRELKNVKQLIIDIRINPGGNDETALLCASYFFREKEIAFIKTARSGVNHNDFTAPDTTYVYPKQKLQADNEQIYLLTNRASGSSADAFALVMSYLPNLTIVGKNTEGIFSNMYRDTLSNGWRLTLSNERYYSRDMICFEKIGVPVDIEVENTFEDAHSGIDSVIEKLVTND